MSRTCRNGQPPVAATTTPKAATTTTSKAGAKRHSRPSQPNKHAIRRILAEDDSAGRETEYLVEWAPTWEFATSIEDVAETVLADWEATKVNNRTFSFNGTNVIKCTNASEDSSGEHTRRMREAVFDHFANFLNQHRANLVHQLFHDDDWVFRSNRHKDDAEAVARAQRPRVPNPSAAEVLRRTYHFMRQQKQGNLLAGEREPLAGYSAIRVRFIGQVDQDMETPRCGRARDAFIKTRSGSSVTEFLTPLLNAQFTKLKNTVWKNETAHAVAQPLHEAVSKFATHAPYILKHPLVLMFTRLFLTSDELVESFAKVNIEMGDDWHNLSRDLFLYTYKDKYAEWENRPVDCVERTYLAARDEVRWFVEHECDGEGVPVGENQGDSDTGDEDENGDVDMEED
ncbi:hypothetical protein BDW02DRAFT_583038 [Decorospora gaudefroyi]|uniref:Uncharacterized protein n=1 Tax=Decorospora gaudefroyi TaxID=184978 RepID=A0A6A5K2C4_9PLEO|nr:hypothetical protein BDW02DRAFT_583038 [Decorospora gaudefroyi]